MFSCPPRFPKSKHLDPVVPWLLWSVTYSYQAGWPWHQWFQVDRRRRPRLENRWWKSLHHHFGARQLQQEWDWDVHYSSRNVQHGWTHIHWIADWRSMLPYPHPFQSPKHICQDLLCKSWLNSCSNHQALPSSQPLSSWSARLWDLLQLEGRQPQSHPWILPYRLRLMQGPPNCKLRICRQFELKQIVFLWVMVR